MKPILKGIHPYQIGRPEKAPSNAAMIKNAFIQFQQKTLKQGVPLKQLRTLTFNMNNVS